MTRPRTILVPLAGTEEALAALPVAQTLAGVLDATVQLVHAGDEALAPRAVLDRLRLPVGEAAGLVLHQSSGPLPRAAIGAARAWESLILVLGSRPGATEAGPDPLAAAVLESACCPIIVVPPAGRRAPWSLHLLLAAEDGSPEVTAALAPMAGLALRARAELRLVHVTDPHPRRVPEAGSFTAPLYLDQPQHEWPAWRREFLERAVERAQERPRLQLNHHIGDPAGEILGAARAAEADLIAIGWRGARGPDRAPAFRAILRQAPCPVIVLRCGAAARW